ncbi:MAG TPA: YSC84-related protein [Pirellulales bacterium]
MKRILLIACALLAAGVETPAWAQVAAENTVRDSAQVLYEIMAIPARRIPTDLLRSAQAVAIVPGVVKIGFIAGIRRGHGVIIMKDAEGEWTLPQFVTLTGGSVGWQAGAQVTDVILVFRTRRSAEGLLSGKLTLGADAAVAAGPVGREAEAATDLPLRSEILSYSRSRGLFLGVSLDGSVIEPDPMAQSSYYGSLPMQVPAVIPPSAVTLVQALAAIAPVVRTVPTPPVPGQPAALPPAAGTVAAPRLEVLRQALAADAKQLDTVLDEQWRQFLRLPQGVTSGGPPPRLADVQAALAKFDRVAQTAQYQALTSRPDFQAAHEVLREYVQALQAAAGPTLSLPAPPSAAVGAASPAIVRQPVR